MGPEEQPTRRSDESQLAAELASLSARVQALEQELAQLRPHPAKPSSPSAPFPSAPPPPRPAPSASAKLPPKPAASLEDRIGSQLFSRIGIVALLIATTLFLKWAIDNQWIGPLGRILAGLVAGAAVVLWSERFRRQGFHLFSYSLKAIGSGALYLSLWAAFQLYHLLPTGIALAAMVLVTAWNAYMAWSQNSELLAAYALAGAFATPILLSSGGNHEIFLFTYILSIDIATVALVRLKPWPRLLCGAFPATVALFFAWFASWYRASTPDEPLIITTLFLALFFLVFIIPSIARQQIDRQPDTPLLSPSIIEILLPLANAAFTALALYAVLDDTHHDLLPWLAVLIAAVYLGLMRLRQSRTTSAIHLSLAVVFLTIAIPLKASGRWITIGWLAEGAALLWVASRLSTSRADTGTDTVAPRILRQLCAAALTLGLLSLFVQPYFEAFDLRRMSRGGLYLQQTAFFNSHFATALFGLAVFASSAWLALHAPRASDQPKEKFFPTWLEIAASSIIAFNFVAVLAVVRELDVLWYNQTAGNPDADLQKSLAISGFLMLYGALLLAAGFWRRSAFIRWQALILLVFTIAKTFLYDLRDLSQGYRVLSFLGLGALLMAISFAYQKDWLALRNSPATAPPPTKQEEANP
jgi:uncharacterized membrane protein